MTRAGCSLVNVQRGARHFQRFVTQTSDRRSPARATANAHDRYRPPGTAGSIAAMQLLVIRHAIAVEPHPGGDDAARHLTAKGRRRFRRGVRGLAKLGFELGAVLHSPWLRAVQTAALTRPLQQRGAVMLASDRLCRPPEPELLTELATAGAGLGHDGQAALAVVGHEPFLGELIGLLTAGDPRAGEALELKKGSVAVLRGSPVAGGMTLCGLLPPRALRALGA